MIRTAIIDDEPLAVELLTDYVAQTAGLQLELAGSDVFKALHMVQQGELDLVLLDIQMPQLTGIQFMKILGDASKVIVTTAYPDYALDGYDLNVADYLLKPISYERFVKAIDKIRKEEAPATASPRGNTVTDFIFVKSEYKLVKVQLSDIVYIESLRDYIAIHTVGKEKIMSLETLKHMEEVLPDRQFIRVHKSYIIALGKINFIERNRIVLGDAYIPVGESYQANFTAAIKELNG